MLEIRDCIRDVVLVYLVPTSGFDIVFYEMSGEIRILLVGFVLFF